MYTKPRVDMRDKFRSTMVMGIADMYEIKLMALYADGSECQLQWKFSGIVGHRLDMDPTEVLILQLGRMSEESVADRCEVYLGTKPLDMQTGMSKYPEYYL